MRVAMLTHLRRRKHQYREVLSRRRSDSLVKMGVQCMSNGRRGRVTRVYLTHPCIHRISPRCKATACSNLNLSRTVPPISQGCRVQMVSSRNIHHRPWSKSNDSLRLTRICSLCIPNPSKMDHMASRAILTLLPSNPSRTLYHKRRTTSRH